jgi:hypothetical protein
MRLLVRKLTTLSFLLPAGIALASAAYLIGCLSLSFGTFSAPEEGFVPLIFGCLLFGGSFLLTVDCLRGILRGSAYPSEIAKGEVLNVLTLTGAMFGYVFLLPILGFSFCTFAIIVASGKIMRAGWRETMLLAAGVTAVGFLLFRVWLNVPLPSGILL